MLVLCFVLDNQKDFLKRSRNKNIGDNVKNICFGVPENGAL
jgi:hypothetical protein